MKAAAGLALVFVAGGGGGRGAGLQDAWGRGATVGGKSGPAGEYSVYAAGFGRWDVVVGKAGLSMITEKLALRPTAAQGRRLEAMAHAYREARNWALSEWERQYRDPSARVVDPSTGEVLLEVPVVDGRARPTGRLIVGLLSRIRRLGQLPTYLRSTADGGVLPALSRNQAVADVVVAYRRWWDALKRRDRRIRRPRPRRASARPGLYLHNQTFAVVDGAIRVTGLGSVKLDRLERYPSARVLSARVVRDVRGAGALVRALPGMRSTRSGSRTCGGCGDSSGEAPRRPERRAAVRRPRARPAPADGPGRRGCRGRPRCEGGGDLLYRG